MANNRLFIEDSESGCRLFVAKSFGEGWDWRASSDDINDWLKARDTGAAYGNTTSAAPTLRFRAENEDGFYPHLKIEGI